jgi:hypothetical protein
MHRERRVRRHRVRRADDKLAPTAHEARRSAEVVGDESVVQRQDHGVERASEGGTHVVAGPQRNGVADERTRTGERLVSLAAQDDAPPVSRVHDDVIATSATRVHGAPRATNPCAETKKTPARASSSST